MPIKMTLNDDMEGSCVHANLDDIGCTKEGWMWVGGAGGAMSKVRFYLT